VLVAPGIYYENDVGMKDGVNLIGAGAALTTIDAQGQGDVIDACVSDCIISGFTLKNCAEYAQGHAGCGIYVDGDYSPTIRNNVIVDNHIGIGIWYGAAPNVRNNIIKNNFDSIYVYGSEEKPSNPSIINNTIANNERGGITLREEVSPVIMNNIIIDHLDGWWWGGVYHDNSWGIHLNYVTGSPALSYNDLWNNDVNYMKDNKSDETLAGIGSISADPIFLDALNNDYRLDLLSPCINAGDPDPLYNDLDGTRNDMGAYGGQFSKLVVTPEETVEEIEGDIPELPGSSEVSLTIHLNLALSKLAQARDFLADGKSALARNRYCQAIGKVWDFIAIIEGKVPNKIDSDTGNYLISEAGALIAMIEAEMANAGLAPCDN